VAPRELELTAQAPARCDVAVVGGGILGLALARQLKLSLPRLGVCVLEREDRLASHQSARNSGVIHSGVYYKPGSLKARLCVQGARELYEYCARNEIPHRRTGKLILASDERQLARLAELERRGRANGAGPLRRVDQRQLAELEPHARALAGLHCANTGIVDFAALAGSLAWEVLEGGGSIACGCGVSAITPRADSLVLSHAHGATEARHAIFCAGAWSDRLAVACGAPADPRVLPFRGAYLRLRGERRELVRSLIYPVPDPELPFLGVHLSRHIDGEVLLGPTALLVGARDAYRLRCVRAGDALDTLSWPGSWRMFARCWRTGLSELHRAVSLPALVRAAKELVPEIGASDLEPAFAGVRAQAVHRDGRLVEDFVFSLTERALHLRNAPSPAATASLAIARHVVERARVAFEL
jgi:(S)-2-hydroxyglutarate dehydrogenase